MATPESRAPLARGQFQGQRPGPGQRLVDRGDVVDGEGAGGAEGGRGRIGESDVAAGQRDCAVVQGQHVGEGDGRRVGLKGAAAERQGPGPQCLVGRADD